MTPGDAILGALEEGSIASAMRDSLWLFPLVETVHIIGFSILVGAVIMFDLRILGISKRISVRLLAHHLLPWSVAALLFIVPSGVLMFASEATDLVGNRAFVVKMLLLMLAGANCLLLDEPTNHLDTCPRFDADLVRGHHLRQADRLSVSTARRP